MTGLKALERIKKSHYIAIAVMGCERDYETENAIESVEKSLKALEIIKEKGVILSILEYSQTVEDYNNAILFSFKPSAYEMCKLTEEEFNILKEVLE